MLENVRYDYDTELVIYEVDEDEPQTPEPFTINSEARANWYLRLIGNIEAEQTRVKAQAEKRIQELDSDRKRLEYLYASRLEAWSRAELTKLGGKRKTLTLLQGSIAFRTVPTTLRVTDRAAAQQWIQTNQPELMTTTTTTSYDLKKYLDLAKKTGEALPGIEATEPHESVTIKFEA